MRRLLIGAASLLAACLTLSPYGVPAADAASPLTGRLVDSVASGHPGVPNMVVRLRAVTASGPGDVVASDVTGDKGYFALDAGSAPYDEYYVQVVAGSHQGGWVGGSPDGINQVEPTAAAGSTYGPHATLGNVRVNPAYVRGVVVDSATDGPVAEVVATVRDSNDPTMVRKDTTNSNGVFRITGVTCEDSCRLRFNGSAAGYETGFRACNAQVVPTWGDACGGPLGRIGRVFIDKL